MKKTNVKVMKQKTAAGQQIYPGKGKKVLSGGRGG